MRLGHAAAWACLVLALPRDGAAAKRKPDARAAAPEPAVQVTRSFSLPVAMPAPKGPPINGQCVVTAGPAVAISALAFHPSGKLLAVGGYREVLVWDLENARLAGRLGAGTLAGQVRAVLYTPDGATLAVADGVPGRSGNVRLMDAAGGKVTASFEPIKDEVLALALSPDGKLLAAGGLDSQVRIWELPSRKPVTTLKDHGGWITGLAFSPDGKFLGSASTDRTSHVWEVDGWAHLVGLPTVVTEPVRGVAFSPDSDVMVFAVGGNDDRGVRIWRTEAVRPQENETEASKARRRGMLTTTRPVGLGASIPLGISSGVIAGPQPLPGRMRFYVPCADKTVRVMNAGGGILATLSGHQDWVYAAVLNAEGTRLATGGADGTVKLWNTADNALLATLVQLAPRRDDWLIVTPRGYFATSDAGSLAWKLANGQPVAEETVRRLQDAAVIKTLLAGPRPAAAR